MKKFKTPIVATLFLIISVLFIASYKSFHFFLPSQQVELSHGVAYGAVLKNFLFVQEITMQKRYVSRVDLYMAKLPSSYTNENVFLLLDEQHRILYTKRFSSADFGEALYFPFDFNGKFDIGKGRKIYACIYSIDGDQGSYIGLAKKENSNLGKLYVVSVVNNDIVQSFEKREGLVNFTGSIGARTFESDTRYFSLLQVVFYIVAFAVFLLILFARQAASFIRKTRILPEYAFLGFSFTFGLVMLVITPPFMVPDEPVHFYRSYQVSEFNFTKLRDDFPKSLVELGSICDRMQFSTHEKTTRMEILSLGNIKTNPAARTTKVTPDYTLPYLPQAIGIAVGKIFGLAPLWLFYLGRLFNLLASIALLFMAIRVIPVFKWVFFLLAIMPMTLYQMASMSYDAVTIGLCFLLLATIFNHMLSGEKKITNREIVVLFVLTALLAAAKQPYSVVILTFLVIPAAKFRSVKHYLAVFAGLVLAVAIVSQLGAVGKAVAGKFAGIQPPATEIGAATNSRPASGEEISSRNLSMAMLPMLPHFPETTNAAQEQAGQQPAAGATSPQPQPNDAAKVNSQIPLNPIDPSAQKNFVLHDPARYAGILLNTLGKSSDLYLTSFVGLFGWIDAPLPSPVAYGYLLFLVFFSMFGAVSGKGISILRKCLISGVFLTGYVLIETALYVYCNPVGCDQITAVQGRYFIAIGPLFFILFSNTIFSGYRQRASLLAAKKPAGKKQHQPVSAPAGSGEMLLLAAMPWIAMVVAFIALTTSLFVILERFYVISV
ncbi:MAG: DUF2142 domain-containing protein [Bacteroidetes bacterium]|nr:DUF2142 domain-containing protein [Bacteroidota bacterium]